MKTPYCGQTCRNTAPHSCTAQDLYLDFLSVAVVCRGLPVEKYSRQEVVTIYWGFGLWWGNVCSQNAK